MLNKDVLTQEGLMVFNALAKMQDMAPFTLIGGTALALQIGHRKSLDLDFWLPDKKLNKDSISIMLEKLRKSGFNANLITPQSNKILSSENQWF